jgi:hypothetical protein
LTIQAGAVHFVVVSSHPGTLALSCISRRFEVKIPVWFHTLLLLFAGCSPASAQISNFQHIVLIVQENRTPDNLFQGLCLAPYGSANACGTELGQYDIQSFGFDKTGTQIPLSPVPLGNAYDPGHSHLSFELMCNPNQATFFPCTANTQLQTRVAR